MRHLLEIMAIKQLCRQSGIERVEAGPKGAVLSFRDGGFIDPASLVRYVSTPENELRLRPDSRLVATRRWPTRRRGWTASSASCGTSAPSPGVPCHASHLALK